MLSSHCENIMQLPYAAVRRAAVLVDHHRRYRSPNAAEVAPSCPRCDSPNTKFCYYNNYSLSQPRYFCKGCRRYWTKGGSLRNVPVGGGCRKNRRAKSAAARSHLGSATVGADAGVPFSHRFPGAAVRPDLLLEGMVGSPAGLGGHLPPVVAAEKPADGSAIDLAFLYAKFLNHQPSAAVVTESADTSSGSSDMRSPNGSALPPDQPFVTSQDGFGNLSEPASAEPCGAADAPHCPGSRADALGELGFFSVDQSCYDSLGLPSTDDGGGDLILPSTWHHRPAKYEPFEPLPEDAMSLHDDGCIAGADDVWSHALACQGLEAALCRP